VFSVGGYCLYHWDGLVYRFEEGACFRDGASRWKRGAAESKLGVSYDINKGESQIYSRTRK
jgi:hypothetical protein